jgi:hypothetical protein
MRNAFILRITAPLLLSAAPPAIAGSYDGSQPLRCAPTNIVGCAADGQCGKETTESVGLPRVLKVDFAQKEITGKRPNGDSLTAPIGDVQHVEDRMILSGTDAGTVWGLLITENTGDMTITVGGDKVGFVGFGGCTPE